MSAASRSPDPRLPRLAMPALLAALAGCEAPRAPTQADEARAALRTYGCVGCHTIEGVAGANGRVGPPLTGIGQRVFIAGALPNSLDNLTAFIVAPRAMRPGTAMPDTGIGGEEARIVARFLMGQADAEPPP